MNKTEENKTLRIRVAGILLINDKILLVSHKKKDDVYWLLPGGGVDYGESLDEALKREFSEELNINIDVHDLVLVNDSIEPGGERHILNMTFVCNKTGGEFLLGDDERLIDFDFFSVEEMMNLKIFPPFKEELKAILLNENTSIYAGKLWQEL